MLKHFEATEQTLDVGHEGGTYSSSLPPSLLHFLPVLGELLSLPPPPISMVSSSFLTSSPSLPSIPPSLPPQVLACLFVTKDNAAGLRLYEKAGYLPVQGDLKRKRFRPLLEAGAIHEEDLEGVVFMCKYMKPLVVRGGGRERGRERGREPGGGWEGLFY